MESDAIIRRTKSEMLVLSPPAHIWYASVLRYGEMIDITDLDLWNLHRYPAEKLLNYRTHDILLKTGAAGELSKKPDFLVTHCID